MTDFGRDRDDRFDEGEVPPIPPLAAGADATLPGPGMQSEPTLAGPTGDPTLAPPATGGPAAPAADGGGTPPPGGGAPPPAGDSGARRPAWLLPAVGGLAVGLLGALGALAFVRGNDADESAATVATVATTVASGEPTNSPVEAPTPDSLAPTTIDAAPATTAPAPASTTAPADPPLPATTLSSNGVPVAPEGFVRIIDTDSPILRRCESNPSAGSAVATYVFDDGFSSTDVVSLVRDVGAVPYALYGDPYEIDDFGDEGFGMVVYQGDGGFAMSVNPTGDESTECAGELTVTNPDDPDDPAFSSITHACSADFIRTFEADLSGNFPTEPGTRFSFGGIGEVLVFDNADGTVELQFSSVEAAGTDSAAVRTEYAAGYEIRATVVGLAGALNDNRPRDVVLSSSPAFVQPC